MSIFSKDFKSCLKIDIEEFNAALRGEEELQRFCGAMRAEILKSDVAGTVEALSSLLSTVDRETLLGSSEIGQYLVDLFNEGLKINSDGWVDDDISFIKPWGFKLSEIKVPVLLYQGSEDKMVPYAHGQWLANHLPQKKLKKHLLQDQGHISLFRHIDGVIDELLESI
jgi:pimeloyl-ACP methyl ester carboxylesterase